MCIRDSLSPLLEIVGSVVLGAALGLLMSLLARFFRSRGKDVYKRQPLHLAFIVYSVDYQGI